MKAVFIDKDGTLVENVPYNVDPERIALSPGAMQSVAEIASRGFRVIVVSNQPGAAQGYFEEEDLQEVEARLRETQAEVRRVFDAAKAHGLPVRLHADQRTAGGGAQLAAEYGALSADHLERTDAEGAAALAAAGTVAVLLPGAFYALRDEEKPPVELTVQVDPPLPPWAIDRLDGLHATLKSGVGAEVTVRLRAAVRVVAPLVPVAWMP